ncbi:DUF4383 domain-containing protein [Xylanimonas sp. McL0601]|uniref:DUF4383 domain-containing protein n=1 Tax=Xylanimonas sp. McL0601 TaxID=3414739 RepID=UPI003CF07AA9
MTTKEAIPSTERRSLNSIVGGVVGGVFIVVGLLGFTVSGHHDAVGHDGGTLVLFQLNVLHNLVHLAVGAVLVAAAVAGRRAARAANVAIGVVYFALGVAGWFISGDNPLNVIALDSADNVLHLVVGAALIGVGTMAGRR